MRIVFVFWLNLEMDKWQLCDIMWLKTNNATPRYGAAYSAIRVLSVHFWRIRAFFFFLPLSLLVGPGVFVDIKMSPPPTPPPYVVAEAWTVIRGQTMEPVLLSACHNWQLNAGLFALEAKSTWFSNHLPSDWACSLSMPWTRMFPFPLLTVPKSLCQQIFHCAW